MQKKLNIPLRLFLCLAVMLGFMGYAATIDAAPSNHFARANFTFEGKAQLNASSQGTRAILKFDKPINQSAGEIESALKGYVNKASISADKKTVTLTLNQPYRLRQFISGKGIGIDLVGEPTSAPPTEEILTTKKPAEEKKQQIKKPEATPTKRESNPQSKPAEKPAPETKNDDAFLTTKKPDTAPGIEKKPQEKRPEPKKPEAVAAQPESSMLTTKQPPEAKPAEPAAASPTKNVPLPEVSVPSLKPAAPQATPAPAAPENTATPASKPEKPSGPFNVTVKTTNEGTLIHFPWKERTAAAVFQREDDIWIIFSDSRDANVRMLRTALPRQVVNVMQYGFPGNTVLRLITSGGIYPRVSQTKGNYGWDVILSSKPSQPQNDTDVTVDSLEDTPRLLIGVFDVSPTLRFFDPSVGDELIVLPSFENGRGVSVQRNFPELSLLPTVQGVAIVTQRHDIATGKTRSGYLIGGAGGLAISPNLPTHSTSAGETPTRVFTPNATVLLAFEPTNKEQSFRDAELERRHAVAIATKATRPEAMYGLAKLYLDYGMGADASGVLDRIAQEAPNFYSNNKLALLSAAAYVLNARYDTAAQYLKAPELDNLEEAAPWREIVALFASPATTAQAIQQTVNGAPTAADVAPPTVAGASPAAVAAPTTAEETENSAVPPTGQLRPVFHYLKYNKLFFRQYPPGIRQRLARIAAEAYLADGQEDKALATYDTLMHDNIGEQLKLDAEYAIAAVAQKKGQYDSALKYYDHLAKQTRDLRNATRGRYAGALLRMKLGKLSADDAANIIESARTGWRGDALERQMLDSLIDIYTQSKRFDDVLRTYKSIQLSFPGAPDTLAISNKMSDLFEQIYLDGLADQMKPLKALSVFYEFRELTPLGEKGDLIVQKLADRLAGIDLIDRATQLLDNQVKFRATGETRSAIGARLALLYLLNHQPQEALSSLEVTNFGSNRLELNIQRQQLTAQALSKLGKNEEALGVLANDNTANGALLKLDILWAMQDWPNVINHSEDILNARPNLAEPLSTTETSVLLKLALAYSFESDTTQLRYLRDYYSGLIPDTNYKQIFDYITNDTSPLDPEDFALVAKQISNTESFLDTFRKKIQAGQLSDTVK